MKAAAGAASWKQIERLSGHVQEEIETEREGGGGREGLSHDSTCYKQHFLYYFQAVPAVGVGKVSFDAQSCDSYCPSAHIKLCLTRLAPPPLGQAPPSTLATPPFCGIIYALQ